MEVLISLAVGVVVACSGYLMMTRDMVRIILGVLMMGYGINLALFMAGGIKAGGPPVLIDEVGAAVTDPVPQALILTAIVIALGVFALLLTLGFRTFQENGSDDFEELTGVEHD